MRQIFHEALEVKKLLEETQQNLSKQGKSDEEIKTVIFAVLSEYKRKHLRESGE